MLRRGGRRSVGDERLQVVVEDVGLLIGKVLEALERLVVGVLAVEFDADLFESLAKGVAARELSEHDFVRGPAYVLGAHDFVGIATLQDAVLMNSGSMRESVGTHYRLVRLNHEPGDLGHQARGRHDLAGVDARLEVEEIAAGAYRHYDFLERSIAGALA